MDKIKILVIVGPTASGKTALSISCAEKFGGEIVSADSMQIYEGLDIATAKPTADEMHGIKHYMIGFLPADKTYSVADYVCDAEKYIKDIHVRGKLPIIVGGTGLYIDSLVNNIKFTQSPTDNELRVKLQKECEENGSEAMRAKLRAMHLLNDMARTESRLRDKLKLGGYPSEITEAAIAYVKSFGYINDEEYVRRYMEYKSGSKSKIQIKMDLRKKGITAETLERVFEEYEYEEDDILEEQVKKRIRQKGSVTKENFQKYYGYFARKGFNSGKILDLLRKYMED